MCRLDVQIQCRALQQERTLKIHADMHADLQQHAAWCGAAQIVCKFCWTSNLHLNAADVLLHIQSAHKKRKCN
jgi:hypothetical protein